VLELAAKTKTPMPYGALLHEQFAAAIAKGWGSEDWACVMKVLELATGTEVSRRAGDWRRAFLALRRSTHLL
jgi:hypothetical protein